MNFPVKIRSLFIICLLATAIAAQSQTTINSVQDKLETIASNFPQEKIYMQFDKPSYAPGETIWFKSYIMSGADPSQISKTVYVDFISTDGRILRHCVLPVLQSGGSGDYGLPLDFKDEAIYVKAYTKWMLNFDSLFLFRKTLHIIQPKPVAKKQAATLKTTMQFLPEGGNIIEGIETNIAFKAVHFDGTPAQVNGVIFEGDNNKVADIKTMHDGMGTFLLTAKNGENYTAKWKDDLGNSYETKLPNAITNGIALKVIIQPNARAFTIQRTENAPANFQKLYIIATMQQHLVYGAGVNLSQVPVTGGSIPIDDLPSGILQVTVFDSNWVAVAERITFINNNNYAFEPEVGFAQLGIDKRQQNTLVIHTDSVTANLSVSITDAGIGIDSSDDIVSHLLMTGDLKGAVYHPYYYFQNNSDTLQRQLDLVMLTNGWRRINWEMALSNKYPAVKYSNEPDYLSLGGKLYGVTEQQLKQGAIILLIIRNQKDTANRLEQVVIDPSGKFSNPNIILYDTTKLYYKISGNDNSSVVDFNSGLSSPKITITDTAANAYLADTATENYKRRIAEEELRNAKFRQGTTLADVVVRTKTKSPMQVLDEKYASPLFSGGDAYQFDVMTDPFGKSATSVFQYLQGKVPGLNITMGGSADGSASVNWRGGTPAFFLDEMPADVSMLSGTSMANVAYIKVLRPPFIGAVGGGANGAIAIYTRRGGDIATTTGKGLPFKIIVGYTEQKEFYSPTYDIYSEKNEDKDLRTTLYWSPNVLTTPTNNTFRFRFYNNDISQSFRVIVEGITTDGKIAHIEKVIE